MVNKLSISGIHWITKEMALRNENGRKNGNGIKLN